jgi:hypothetical protein
MSKHASISPTEAADRLAIRELVEAYAHCADRRDAKGQMALFTEDTHFVVFMNAKDPTTGDRAQAGGGAGSGMDEGFSQESPASGMRSAPRGRQAVSSEPRSGPAASGSCPPFD